MDSTTSFKLTHIAEILRDDLPFSISLIDSLLLSSQHPPVLGFIIRLLCLQRTSIVRGQTKYNKQQQLKTIAKLLDYFCPILDTRAPLKYLISRQFEKFDTHCKESGDPEMEALAMRSHGLYPPKNVEGQSSIFSRYYQKEGYEGNSHWVLARYGMLQWFIINKDRLPLNIRQSYSFLLAEKEFVEKSSGIFKLWALLYAYYTQSVLQQAWKESEETDQRYCTWTKAEFSQYASQFGALQHLLNGEFKLIYYLIAELLPSFSFQLQKGLFPLAYGIFTKLPIRVSEWRILIQTLFLKIAEIRREKQIAIEIKHRVRDSLEKGELKGMDYFKSIYFRFEELLPKIIIGQVNYMELMLTDKQKSEVAGSLLLKSNFNENLFKYLSKDHFYYILTTTKWVDAAFAGGMLSLLAQYRPTFIQKLKQITGQVDQRIVQIQFNMFFDAWSSYYQLLFLPNPDLLLFFKATVEKNTFRPKFQFLIIPRDCSEVIFRLVINQAKYYEKNKVQLETGGSALKQFKQFQEKELPRLIGLLSQEQLNQFWKEWVEVLKYDPDFVAQVLHPAQRSAI